MEFILLISGIFKLLAMRVGNFIALILKDGELEDNEPLGAFVIVLTLSAIGFFAVWLR